MVPQRSTVNVENNLIEQGRNEGNYSIEGDGMEENFLIQSNENEGND